MPITFTELAEAKAKLEALPRPIVHYKGFAARLCQPVTISPPSLGKAADFGKPDPVNLCAETESGVEALLRAVAGLGARTLVWDGDGLEDDSFTALIPLLATDVLPDLKLCAFLHEKRREKFIKAWSGFADAAGKQIDVYIVPPPGAEELKLIEKDHTRKFTALGIAGLRATAASEVVCLGGGAVLKSEYEHSRELPTPPRFTLVPVRRVKITKREAAPAPAPAPTSIFARARRAIEAAAPPSAEDGGNIYSAESASLLGVDGVTMVALAPPPTALGDVAASLLTPRGLCVAASTIAVAAVVAQVIKASRKP